MHSTAVESRGFTSKTLLPWVFCAKPLRRDKCLAGGCERDRIRSRAIRNQGVDQKVASSSEMQNQIPSSIGKGGEDGANVIRSAGEACHTQALDAGIITKEVKVLRRSVIFRNVDGLVGKSKPELVEWMKDMLKGKG